MNLYGQALRDAIDEAIAEIDRVEEDMLELIAELVGPDAAVKLVAYARAQEERSVLRGLMTDAEDEGANSARSAASSEPLLDQPRTPDQHGIEDGDA